MKDSRLKTERSVSTPLALYVAGVFIWCTRSGWKWDCVGERVMCPIPGVVSFRFFFGRLLGM